MRALRVFGLVIGVVLLGLADYSAVFSIFRGQGSTHPTVSWYRQHPDALAEENVKCWKLIHETPFDQIDQVMAAHPRCRVAYEAQYGDD